MPQRQAISRQLTYISDSLRLMSAGADVEAYRIAHSLAVLVLPGGMLWQAEMNGVRLYSSVDLGDGELGSGGIPLIKGQDGHEWYLPGSIQPYNGEAVGQFEWLDDEVGRVMGAGIDRNLIIRHIASLYSDAWNTPLDVPPYNFSPETRAEVTALLRENAVWLMTIIGNEMLYSSIVE